MKEPAEVVSPQPVWIGLFEAKQFALSGLHITARTLAVSRLAYVRRPASLRLGLETAALRLRFLALAPVHPVCA